MLLVVGVAVIGAIPRQTSKNKAARWPNCYTFSLQNCYNFFNFLLGPGQQKSSRLEGLAAKSQ